MPVGPYYDYRSGSGAVVVAVPANKKLLEASVIAGLGGCTMQIGTDDLIPVPSGATFSPWPNDEKGLVSGPVNVTIAGDVASFFVAWGV